MTMFNSGGNSRNNGVHKSGQDPEERKALHEASYGCPLEPPSHLPPEPTPGTFAQI